MDTANTYNHAEVASLLTQIQEVTGDEDDLYVNHTYTNKETGEIIETIILL